MKQELEAEYLATFKKTVAQHEVLSIFNVLTTMEEMLDEDLP